MGERHHAHGQDARLVSPKRGYDPATLAPPDLLTQDAKGLPYRYEDSAEMVHAVEGTRNVPTDTRTFFMWTRCGQQEVAAGEVYAGAGKPSCPVCAEIEAQSPGADQSSASARLLRADLAFARGRARIARLEKEDEDAARAYDDTRNYESIVRSLERKLKQ